MIEVYSINWRFSVGLIIFINFALFDLSLEIVPPEIPSLDEYFFQNR